MRALDLFCGAGGASRGLADAGFEVVGVDLHPQPNYPFEFVQGNAMAMWADSSFDLIWASPPCQHYSSMTRQTGKPEKHPDLIGPLRERLKRNGLPYVIENVLSAPLVDPITLCGAMFDLGVIRHRLFECSWPVEQPPHRKHSGSLVTGEYVTVTGNGGVPAWTLTQRELRGLPRHRPGEYSLANWQRAMGIDWGMTRKELSQAIPPAYAEWLGRKLP